jgi:hypothetical protein
VLPDITHILASYPRKRPVLPPANAKLYIEEYKLNRGIKGGLLYSATAELEAWMHRKIAKRGGGRRVLELGAGTLNHLRYEATAPVYEIVEPMQELLSGRPELARVSRVYRSVHDIPSEIRYDRILSIAVLEHLDDLPLIVASSALLLSDGGLFQAGIPAEGGLVWGLAWRVSTGISYRCRTGLSYTSVMRHEHLSMAEEIIAVLRHFFANVTVRWFPVPLLQLALYGYIEARHPLLERCQAVKEARRSVTTSVELRRSIGVT